MRCTTPSTVLTVHRIIQAIGVAVMSQHPLTGGELDIGGDEAAEFGVIVSALQVVEPCLFIIHIAAIAEGLFRAKGLCERTAC